jgi:branched-chain amino acid transport system ATP-binding protein
MNEPDRKKTSHKPLLTLNSIAKAFGGVQALWNISFDLKEGMVQALIGPNGAGKTTLFNLITGIFTPDSGEILFDGRPIGGKKVYDLVQVGIARTFQNVELFGSMTALENVMVGQHVRTRCGFWSAVTRTPWMVKEETASRKKALKIMAFVGIDHLANRRSSELSFGWQRLLEIARALSSSPRLLLLDEPAAGLNTVETRKLGTLLKKIQAQGITLLLVEHDMGLIMDISNRIVVLDQGEKIAEGTPREVQSNEAVMSAYLGRSEH